MVVMRFFSLDGISLCLQETTMVFLDRRNSTHAIFLGTKVFLLLESG